MPLERADAEDKPENFFQRELTGRRLVFNILFYVGHLCIFAWGWHLQSVNERLAILNLLKFSVWSSRGAGLCLGVDGALLLLPVCRNLIRIFRPTLAGIVPLDESLWFHRQIAYATLFFTIIHTTAHYVNMFMVEQTQVRPETAVAIMYTQPGAFTGHVMLLIMVLMYTTAHHRIRAQCFEAFWYTHHLAFFWMLGLYTHATGCFVRGALPGEPVECLGYHTIYVTWIGGVLYFLERILREVRARRHTEIKRVALHPSGAMEIQFIKPSFKYAPGQWLFLQVPEVSRWQWHPFTISSSPNDKYISVHIRQVGDFTIALGERLGATKALAESLTAQTKKGIEVKNQDDLPFVDITGVQTGFKLPAMRIDGPYGAPAEDVFSSQIAVLVCAGIGVTPFASVLKDIRYQLEAKNVGSLKKVEFVWINRDAASFGWFRQTLQSLESYDDKSNARFKDFVKMHMYLTSTFDQNAVMNFAVNHVPHPKDSELRCDPVTGFKTTTRCCRPDWRQFFQGMKSEIDAGTYVPGIEGSLITKVGVFYCGPNPLAKDLKRECQYASAGKIRFNFYKEHF